ncbi:MAG: hypothetical protein ABIT08_05910 [Bacteroidia bacterium]
MESIRIDIKNKEASAIIRQLEKLNLIEIHKDNNEKLRKLLKKLRSKAKTAPSMKEITKEVELVRKKRYER